ncbi:MAG: superoxide dismutase [Bacteroidota bacterium]
MRYAVLPLFLLFNAVFVALAQPYTLPKLPYAYQDYAPYIDAQTMEIHLTKHHQAYVNNLNKTVKGTPYDDYTLEDVLLNKAALSSDAIRNNAGGHYNHSLFWEILAPKAKQGAISADLSKEINTAFGNLDSLKKELNKAAMSRFGSGWAWLILTPELKLAVVSTANQDNPLMPFEAQRGIPIAGIDVWEHAYYLNYQNRRADYLSAVWELLNWQIISEKYQQARENTALMGRLVPLKKKKKG